MPETQSGHFRRPFKYYELLGISKHATQNEIKQAYRQLAKKYHPDVNRDPEAQKLFQKINEAHEVLGNEEKKLAYDSSPAECLLCYTHEVILTIGTLFRCRHCGCQFKPATLTSNYEIIERAVITQIPNRLKKAVLLFQTTRCSWCRKFYTNEPFLCPQNMLRSNCLSFRKLSDEEKSIFLANDRWWWRMYDMLSRVQDKGRMARCKSCLALNPNPDPMKSVCWQCGGDTLRCPNLSCKLKPILIYYIDQNMWKCPNAQCSKKYAYFAKQPRKQFNQEKPEVELTPSDEICEKCGKILYFDAKSVLWKCKTHGCQRVYTYKDIHRKRDEFTTWFQDLEKTKPTKTEATTEPTKTGAMKEIKQDSKFMTWIIIAALSFIVVVFILIAWMLLGR